MIPVSLPYRAIPESSSLALGLHLRRGYDQNATSPATSRQWSRRKSVRVRIGRRHVEPMIFVRVASPLNDHFRRRQRSARSKHELMRKRSSVVFNVFPNLWLPPYSDEASAKQVGDLFDRSFGALRMIDHSRSARGMMIADYEPAGPVKRSSSARPDRPQCIFLTVVIGSLRRKSIPI